MTISQDALLAQLRWRYATKKFDASRKVPERTWAAIEQAMLLSPSSFGLQPWRFVVITDPRIKAQLPAISWGQTQPQDCSHMVVFAARKGINAGDVEKFAQSIADARGGMSEAVTAYKNMMLGTINGRPAEALDAWCARQCYIALGFLLETCALLEVDACPMEGIDSGAYDKLLGLTEKGFTAVAGCPVGYRAADDRYAQLPKVRYPSHEVVIRV